jgi:hypothetical protein
MSAEAGRFRLGVGVAVPTAVLGLAYALWWISDRLVQIGPIDRAVFGWVVVVPVWAAAPLAAALAWRGLSDRQTVAAASILGGTISAVAALLFWMAVAHPDCQFGPSHPASAWMLPSLIVGVVIGAGPPLSGLMIVGLVRNGHPWQAALLGFAAELGLVFVAIFAAGLFLLGPGCNRPF